MPIIAALLEHPSIEAAAKSVGIGTATAWRWMKDPDFIEQYRDARREAMRHTTARLQEAAREAVECLREVQPRATAPVPRKPGWTHSCLRFWIYLTSSEGEYAIGLGTSVSVAHSAIPVGYQQWNNQSKALSWSVRARSKTSSKASQPPTRVGPPRWLGSPLPASRRELSPRPSESPAELLCPSLASYRDHTHGHPLPSFAPRLPSASS